MKAEKKQKIRKAAEKAYILFAANPDWRWVFVPGDGRPQVEDIYRQFQRMAKETRRNVRDGEDESILSLGRLTVRSYFEGEYLEGNRAVVTEFCVETGYVI